MAADDDDRGSAPDPWDDIVAEGLGEDAGEVSFRFEEAASEAAPAAEMPQEESADGGPASDADAAEHALVEDWLSEDDDADAGAPPLSVFPTDDVASGSSTIDIGTGTSGIALHGAPEQEEIGAEAFTTPDGEDADAAVTAWPDADAGGQDDGAVVGFPDLAAGGAAVAGVAAAASAAKPVRRSAKPASKKSGGIGQMIGVVLGGLMAIPITLGILIYGLGKDPFGVTKQVPADVAFLLPEKFRPGYRKPSAAPAGAGASSLDSLPTVTEPTAPGLDEVAAGAGEPALPEEPVVPDEAAVADTNMPPEPEPEPVPDVAAIDVPSLDSLDATPVPAPAAVAEPPPLDTAALDEAVGDAAALAEALGTVDDRGTKAYTLLRTRWYRALARVAEELVAVENTAASTGRPLEAIPDNVAALQGTIGGRDQLAAELAALAPDWLAYEKRGSDGVVLPVTFESARKVGPYWATRVSLTGADGSARSLTIISRSEPAAIAGDRVVVTGVALDGAVVWAADVRGLPAGL